MNRRFAALALGAVALLAGGARQPSASVVATFPWGGDPYRAAEAMSAVLGDSVYFSVATLCNGTQLWKSDGTADGTGLVADLGGSVVRGPMIAFKGAVYFVAADDAHGAELWRSDGSAGESPV